MHLSFYYRSLKLSPVSDVFIARDASFFPSWIISDKGRPPPLPPRMCSTVLMVQHKLKLSDISLPNVRACSYLAYTFRFGLAKCVHANIVTTSGGCSPLSWFTAHKHCDIGGDNYTSTLCAYPARFACRYLHVYTLCDENRNVCAMCYHAIFIRMFLGIKVVITRNYLTFSSWFWLYINLNWICRHVSRQTRRNHK